MAHKHRRQAQSCANTEMPEGLTEELLYRINLLPSSVKTDYLKQEVFSKFVSSDTDAPEIRRQRAINKWLSVEKDNEATNDRLILTPEDFQILPRVSYGDFMSFCRTYIVKVIGETAPLDCLLNGKFSGGASTSRPRTESHPASKYLGKAHVTSRCLEVFATMVEDMPGWIDGRSMIEPVIVPGNVMFTVPKKTDIDRVACKEPDLNMYIQKGIGQVIRDRLLTEAGIDLREQANNRSLARSGSISGELATFDLSSASDSVTTQLVAELLPVCWFTLLDSVRSPVTIIDGEVHRNHMFSSMGNGFTFELESLIFLTITKAICYFTGTRGVVSIYGDDIICPTGISEILPFVFGYLGFTVNPDKSHTTGHFRESCGGHYSNGLDITPFYVKAPIHTLLDVIDVANKLRKWAEVPGLFILDPEVESIWQWLKSFVPPRLWGGWDTNSKYQLVSCDASSHRMVEETLRKDNGTGGYYHWLNTTWDRQLLRDEISTSSRSIPLTRFRIKKLPNHTVARCTHAFYQELCVTPSISV